MEEIGFQIAKFIFDDCGDMTLALSEKKEREERFQNYIKAGSGKVSEKEAKEKVSGPCVPETGSYLKVLQKHLPKETLLWKKMILFLNGR